MDILLLIFAAIGLLGVAAIVTINYKGGYLLNNKGILIGILCLILIVGFISYTALPSDYTIQKIVIIVIQMLGIVSCGMKLFNKGNETLIRVFITLSLIVSYVVMIL